MTNVQFGWLAPQGETDSGRAEFVKAVRRALDLIVGSFDSVWLSDHLQFGDSILLEGWTELAYFVGMQPALKYGHIVLSQLFRNPAQLAKMAATFQYMSQGNFILGLGAGWNQEECDAYGLPFPDSKQRVEGLEETLQIIKMLWKGEKSTFTGTHHSIKDAYCQPKPEPEPSIMLASSQPKMMRLCAQYADWWHTPATDPAKLKEQLTALDKACEALGRDPATLKRTLSLDDIYCAPNEKELRALTSNRQINDEDIVGTPAQIIERLQELADLGISYFMFRAGGFPQLASLETLVHEVVPAFARK